MMANSSVAVIIVNYGTADLALTAVASVLAADHGPLTVSLHLVDNASPNGDGQQLAAEIAERGWSDKVAFYPETTNHGFGRGSNVVIDRLIAQPESPDFVFLLNPDAQLENDAILRLWQHMQEHPEIGACGSRIEDEHGIPVTAAFRFPSAVSTFTAAASFGPISRLFARHDVPLAPDLPTQRVDWVAGAAVLLRTKALKEVGGFDPSFFLYYEEVDLMLRMARNGWQTWFVAEARVSHKEGASTGVRSGQSMRKRLPDYWYQSWRYYFRENHGRGYALLAGVNWGAGTMVNKFVSALRFRETSAPLNFFADHWRHVMRPLIRDEGVHRSKKAARATVTKCNGAGKANHNPEGITFRALVAEDFRAHGSDWFSQGFWALFWHRFGNRRMDVRSILVRPILSVIYRVMAKQTQWFCGIDLPYTVVVGRRVVLEHFGGMILVAESIGDDVTIRQNTTMGVSGVTNDDARPVIGNGVDIGAGAVILGAVRVGDHAVIGANAVVVRDVPPMSVSAGVPAKVLRNRDPSEVSAAFRRRKGFSSV